MIIYDPFSLLGPYVFLLSNAMLILNRSIIEMEVPAYQRHTSNRGPTACLKS